MKRNHYMRKSRFALSGAAVAAALSLTLVAPSMASASAGVSATGSTAYYNSSTNTLYSTDTKSDGASSGAQLRSNAVYKTLINSGGIKTTENRHIQNPASTVYIRACKINLSKGTGIYGCSGWASTTG
jgi:ABC-type oligopeptide transport system substrate-binding subunit